MAIKSAHRTKSFLFRDLAQLINFRDSREIVEDIKTLDGNDIDLQNQINAIIADTIPHMTTAQRLAIVSPTSGMVVYDTDYDDIFQFDLSQAIGEQWRLVGAKGMLVQQSGLTTTNIPAGTTQIWFGNSAPTPSGGGNFIQIAGTANKVPKFNAGGILVQGSISDFGNFYQMSLQTVNIDGLLTSDGMFYFLHVGGVTTLRLKTPVGVVAVELSL